jgi:hypothetical protein
MKGFKEMLVGGEGGKGGERCMILYKLYYDRKRRI